MLKQYFPLFQMTIRLKNYTVSIFSGKFGDGVHEAADRGKRGGSADIQSRHDIAIQG